MGNAKLVAEKLSDVQFRFILSEFGIDEVAFRALSDDDLDNLYDEIGFIEVEETMAADEQERELTDRGKVAVSIVTLIGNELYQSDDEDTEEN